MYKMASSNNEILTDDVLEQIKTLNSVRTFIRNCYNDQLLNPDILNAISLEYKGLVNDLTSEIAYKYKKVNDETTRRLN